MALATRVPGVGQTAFERPAQPGARTHLKLLSPPQVLAIRPRPTVAIIEDERSHHRLLQLSLQVSNQVVTDGPTASMEEALRIIEEKRPEVVIIDMFFERRGEKSGIALASELRKRHPRMVLLLYSASADSLDKDEKLLFDAVLPKGTNLATIGKAVASASKMPTVMIIDDFFDVELAAVLPHLRGLARFVNIGAITSAQQAIEIFRREMPQVVLLDLNLSEDAADYEGFEILEAIRKLAPGTRVILTTTAYNPANRTSLQERLESVTFDLIVGKAAGEAIADYIRALGPVECNP